MRNRQTHFDQGSAWKACQAASIWWSLPWTACQNSIHPYDASIKKNIHFKQDSKHNSDILISVQTMGTKTGGFITGNCMIWASSLFNKGLSIWALIGQKLLPTFEPLCLMIIQGRINFAKRTIVSTATYNSNRWITANGQRSIKQIKMNLMNLKADVWKSDISEQNELIP